MNVTIFHAIDMMENYVRGPIMEFVFAENVNVLQNGTFPDIPLANVGLPTKLVSLHMENIFINFVLGMVLVNVVNANVLKLKKDNILDDIVKIVL